MGACRGTAVATTWIAHLRYNPDLARFRPEHCKDCEAGTFCAQEGTAYSSQWPCPEGHWCQEKCDAPVACAGGKYNPLISQTNETACRDCPEDFWCPEASPSPLSCADATGEYGYYCPPMSANRTICPHSMYVRRRREISLARRDGARFG